MENFTCKYCGNPSKKNSLKSLVNHERCCPKNPNRNYKNGMLGKQGSNQYLKSKELGLEPPKYDFSNRKRGGWAAWTKEERSVRAKEQNFGGYRENAGISKKYKVIDSFGNPTLLQSSYELKCSEILNELNIKWLRPKHLKYGNNKKYFADFYLPDYDIYLDPKNTYKAKLDEEKIKTVILDNSVSVFILTEDKLNKDYIKNLTNTRNYSSDGRTHP